MNKRILNAFAVVLAIAAFSTTSCKKSDDAQSRRNLLTQNQWTLSKMGGDTDGNSVMETTEVAPVASMGMSANVNFSGDNTYQLVLIAGDTTVFKGNWALINGDQTIRTVVTNQGPNDTTLLDIHDISSSNLTLLQRTDSTGVWEVFTK